MFRSIFGKSIAKYEKVKTNNKNIGKTLSNNKKEYYVNMLYIYFFNNADYANLCENNSSLSLPIIEKPITITVCNNCNNIHKAIKNISYVRYSTKNGLQKTQKFKKYMENKRNKTKISRYFPEFTKKNNGIKQIKSTYTTKFNLLSKNANYPKLHYDIIDCLKKLSTLLPLPLDTAMYFIINEKIKKESFFTPMEI